MNDIEYKVHQAKLIIINSKKIIRLEIRNTCSIKLRICDGNCVWHFNWLTDSSWNICENNKIPSLKKTQLIIHLKKYSLSFTSVYIRT